MDKTNIFKMIIEALNLVKPLPGVGTRTEVKTSGRKHKRVKITEKTKLSTGRDAREKKDKKARKMAERSRRINRSRR